MPIDFRSKKSTVFVILAIVLAVAAWQTFQNRTSNTTSSRYSEYLALRGKPLDADGQRQMEIFVQGLASVLAKVEAFPILEDGAILPRGPHDTGFELHLCDLGFLRKVVGQVGEDSTAAGLAASGLLDKLPSFFGNADFPSNLRTGKWNQGTLAEAKNLIKDRYFLIFCPLEFDPPQAFGGNGHFKGGLLRGRTYLADFESKDLIASLDLKVQNQGSVQVGKYKTAAAQEKDLMEDLEKSLLSGLDLVADSLLGIPLPDYGAKIRGLK